MHHFSHFLSSDFFQSFERTLKKKCCLIYEGFFFVLIKMQKQDLGRANNQEKIH